MAAPTLDVVGIGNAIVDVQSRTDDAFLATQGLVKGTMALIDAPRAESLYALMGRASESSGGSAANTIAGIASLGRQGRLHRQGGATTSSARSSPATCAAWASPTTRRRSRAGRAPARCLILVTPDAQRTMNTFLGASVEFEAERHRPRPDRGGAGDLSRGLSVRPADRQGGLPRAPPRSPTRPGASSPLSLRDPFCVERHRADFRDLVASSHRHPVRQRDRDLLALRDQGFRQRGRARCAASARSRC